MEPRLIFGPEGHYHEDDGSIEYDEHGNPTPEQLKRWKEIEAAGPQQLLDEVNESIAESRRQRAAKIAAGIDPGPRLISRERLLAAGALEVPPAWRKSLGGGSQQQLDLFGDEDTDSTQGAASADEDAE